MVGHDFAPCVEAGEHKRAQRHRRGECAAVRWVVWDPGSGRVFTAPGGRVWCLSVARILGEPWEVKEAE